MRTKRTAWLVVAIAFSVLMVGAVALAKPAPPRPPNCKYVLCAYPDCLPNEHTQIPPGQCCPVCVPN